MPYSFESCLRMGTDRVTLVWAEKKQCNLLLDWNNSESWSNYKSGQCLDINITLIYLLKAAQSIKFVESINVFGTQYSPHTHIYLISRRALLPPYRRHAIAAHSHRPNGIIQLESIESSMYIQLIRQINKPITEGLRTQKRLEFLHGFQLINMSSTRSAF